MPKEYKTPEPVKNYLTYQDTAKKMTDTAAMSIWQAYSDASEIVKDKDGLVDWKANLTSEKKKEIKKVFLNQLKKSLAIQAGRELPIDNPVQYDSLMMGFYGFGEGTITKMLDEAKDDLSLNDVYSKLVNPLLQIVGIQRQTNASAKLSYDDRSSVVNYLKQYSPSDDLTKMLTEKKDMLTSEKMAKLVSLVDEQKVLSEKQLEDILREESQRR
jgi:hypothetical protein